MRFPPYHQFQGCERLERLVRALRDANTVDDATYSAFQTYHYSLLHKLRCAHHHTTSLSSYLRTQSNDETPPNEVVYWVNFCFDGFTHQVGSAMDILAREVLSYFGIPLPARVYFQTAREQIAANRGGDQILPLLDDPSWRSEFANYRNAATHERVVGTSYQIGIDVQGDLASRRLVFPLPDDPRAPVDQRTFAHNPDVGDYVERTLRRTLTVCNRVYTHLHGRIRTARALPI